jgi:hypothetical protein
MDEHELMASSWTETLYPEHLPAVHDQVGGYLHADYQCIKYHIVPASRLEPVH